MKNEIVLFTDGDINIEVQINPEQETVWFTQKQMEALFDVKHATLSEHITNILASAAIALLTLCKLFVYLIKAYLNT